jgi:hypothetical protein
MVGDVPQSSPQWTLRGSRPKCSKNSVPKVLFKTTNNENAVILFFSLHHGGDPPTVFTNPPVSSSKRIFPLTMVHLHILIVFRFQHVVTKRLPNIKNKESERKIGSSSTIGRFLLIWREGGAQEWRSTLLGFTCSRRGGLQNVVVANHPPVPCHNRSLSIRTWSERYTVEKKHIIKPRRLVTPQRLFLTLSMWRFLIRTSLTARTNHGLTVLQDVNRNDNVVGGSRAIRRHPRKVVSLQRYVHRICQV